MAASSVKAVEITFDRFPAASRTIRCEVQTPGAKAPRSTSVAVAPAPTSNRPLPPPPPASTSAAPRVAAPSTIQKAVPPSPTVTESVAELAAASIMPAVRTGATVSAAATVTVKVLETEPPEFVAVTLTVSAARGGFRTRG